MRAMKPRSGRAAEDRVFNAVQNAILDHRLAPGTKLVERDLSELLGVSRRGARGAGAPGAQPAGRAASEPRRGHRQPDAERDARRIRGAPRHRIGRSAGSRAQHHREAARRAARLRRRGAKAYDRGDRGNGQRLSIRFHKLLSELAGNGALDRFMEHLICRTPLLTLAQKGSRQGSRHAYCGADEHREIVDALARRDPVPAARRMTSHLSTLQKQLHVEEEPRPASTLAEAFA